MDILEKIENVLEEKDYKDINLKDISKILLDLGNMLSTIEDRNTDKFGKELLKFQRKYNNFIDKENINFFISSKNIPK